LAAPFLVIYELGLVALRLGHENFHERNGADAIIRALLFPLRLQQVGAAGAFLWSIVSVLVLVACFFVWRAREGAGEPFRGRYVGWLFAESFGWALVLFLASVLGMIRHEGARTAADASGMRLAAEIVFNAGAGVYEELVFRVFLVLLLVLFFTKVVHLERVRGGLAAALAAAVIFSLVHFGSHAGADPWGGPHFWTLFVFRAAAGLFFSLLFCFRGFGVAVATHALYDNMVTAANAFR
jgi:hypothetical protein